MCDGGLGQRGGGGGAGAVGVGLERPLLAPRLAERHLGVGEPALVGGDERLELVALPQERLALGDERLRLGLQRLHLGGLRAGALGDLLELAARRPPDDTSDTRSLALELVLARGELGEAAPRPRRAGRGRCSSAASSSASRAASSRSSARSAAWRSSAARRVAVSSR